jgi:hypothetical protein
MGDKYDAQNWADGLYEKDYKEISGKIAEAIKELRNKSAIEAAK